MAEAAPAHTPTDDNGVPLQSIAPGEVSAELRPRIDELDLWETVEQLREHGYGVIRNAGPPALMDEAREAIHAIARKPEGGQGMASAPMLLGRHRAIDRIATLPKIMAIAEFSVGKAMRIGRIVASIKCKGDGGPGVHSDQNWLPWPFPEHNCVVTFCTACEGMTAEGGATCVAPGSHRLRRPPSPDEITSAATIPIETEQGDVAVWDGAAWHGSPKRNIDGTRTVIHATYQRLYTPPIDDFTYLLQDEEYIATASDEIRQLLGENLFFHTAKPPFQDTDMKKFMYATAAAKL